ncbi:unnamed protein product [Closterium sp. NIES-64]|nr:unnamed protein product [Closterium sp. NIES-64]
MESEHGEISVQAARVKLTASSSSAVCRHVGGAGGGDTIACLQKHVEDEDMGEQCKTEVKKDEERSAHDFRLNYKAESCVFQRRAAPLHARVLQCLAAPSPPLPPKNDSLTTAGGSSGGHGGRVLQCLAYFERREVGDVMLDVPLQRVCVDDIGALCELQRGALLPSSAPP